MSYPPDRLLTPASSFTGDDLRLSEHPPSSEDRDKFKTEPSVDVMRDRQHRAELGVSLKAAAERERELSEQVAVLQSELSMRPQVEDLARITASWQTISNNAKLQQQQFNAECASLRTRVAELSSDLAKARDREKAAEGRAEGLVPLLDATRKELLDKCAQVETLQQVVSDMTAQEGETLRREDNLRKELDITRAKAQKLPGLEKSLADWQNRARSQEFRAQSLATENVSLRSEALKFIQLKSTLAKRASEAETVAKHVRELESEAALLRQTADSTAAQVAALTSRAEAAESRAGQLETDCKVFRDRLEMLEAALDARNNTALESVAKLRGEIEALQVEAQKVPALEVTLADLRSQAQRIPELETAGAQCDARATSAENYAHRLKDEVTSLRQNLDHAVNTRLTAMSSRAEAAEGRLQQSQIEILSLRARLELVELAQGGLASRAEAAEGRVRELDELGRSLRAQAEVAEAEYADLVHRFKAVEGYLIESDAIRTRLEEEVAALGQALASEMETRPTESEGEERMRSERESLLEGMRELLPSGYVSSVSDASEVLRAVEDEFDRLRTQVSDSEVLYNTRASRYAMLQARVAQLERNSWRY